MEMIYLDYYDILPISEYKVCSFRLSVLTTISTCDSLTYTVVTLRQVVVIIRPRRSKLKKPYDAFRFT